MRFEISILVDLTEDVSPADVSSRLAEAVRSTVAEIDGVRDVTVAELAVAPDEAPAA